jgi:hypothetical protein
MTGLMSRLFLWSKLQELIIEDQRLIDNATQLIYQLNRVCYQGAQVMTIFSEYIIESFFAVLV